MDYVILSVVIMPPISVRISTPISVPIAQIIKVEDRVNVVQADGSKAWTRVAKRTRLTKDKLDNRTIGIETWWTSNDP